MEMQEIPLLPPLPRWEYAAGSSSRAILGPSQRSTYPLGCQLQRDITTRRYDTRCRIRQRNDPNILLTDRHVAEEQGVEDGRAVLEGDLV